jgi:hypothetical protein
MEAHMPRKQQSTHKEKTGGKSKPDLGQKEAASEKTGKEKMSHMEEGQSGNRSQQQPTKRDTK